MDSDKEKTEPADDRQRDIDPAGREESPQAGELAEQSSPANQQRMSPDRGSSDDVIPVAEIADQAVADSARLESIQQSPNDAGALAEQNQEVAFVGPVRQTAPPVINSQGDHRAPPVVHQTDDEKGADQSEHSPGDSQGEPHRARPPVRHRMIVSTLARENVASIGGAVASIALGILAIVGSLFTPLSIINAGLGILLGLWGMASPRKRLALIGLLICLLACCSTIGIAIYQANPW